MKGQEIAATTAAPLAVTNEQRELVKRIIFPDADNNELALFFYECERRGVHPLDKLIIPIKRNEGDTGQKRVTFQCSIDYFHAAAAETDLYDGQDEPEFGATGEHGYPEWAKVAVYRKDVSRPFIGIARWTEYYPGEKMGFMWRKMPHGQLAKCAEALAFRKAFPQKLSGLYADEEMHQAFVGVTPTAPLVASVREMPPIEQTAAAQHREQPVDEPTPPTPPPPTPPPPTPSAIKEALKAELAAYAPDPTARAALLKRISIFGNKGSEKWIRDIDAASDKWCEKSLGNLRKLAEESQMAPPPIKPLQPPKSCTKNPRTCDSSQWLAGGDDCDCVGMDGARCYFLVPSEESAMK